MKAGKQAATAAERRRQVHDLLGEGTGLLECSRRLGHRLAHLLHERLWRPLPGLIALNDLRHWRVRVLSCDPAPADPRQLGLSPRAQLLTKAWGGVPMEGRPCPRKKHGQSSPEAAAGRMTARFAGFAAQDDVFIESQLKCIGDRL